MSEPKESQRFINLGVVLNKKGEVLMIRRVKEEVGRDGSILRWAFPGGWQRFNEAREDSVKRGVLSETGYEVKVERQIAIGVHPQMFVVVVYHLCYSVSEDPIRTPNRPEEIAEIRWVKPDEIEKLITTELNSSVKKQLGLR